MGSLSLLYASDANDGNVSFGAGIFCPLCIPKDLPNGHRMLAHLHWVEWGIK